MSRILPYEAIPFVEWSSDYQHHLADLLVQAYQEHGPIFRTKHLRYLPHNEIVFLVGPEANRFVLVDQRQKFSNLVGWSTIFPMVKVFGRGLLTMDGEEHARIRRLFNPAFTMSYISRYLTLINSITRKKTKSWLEAGEVNLHEEISKIAFEVAAQALAGLKGDDEIEHFRTLFLRFQMLTPSLEDFEARLASLRSELDALLVPKIEEQRRQLGDDIFGRLVQARDEHGNTMSDEQIMAHVNTLLIAGHETTTSLSTWLLYLLHQHPDYTQRILREQEAVLGASDELTLEDIKRMQSLDNALHETERLYPPIPNGPRGVVEDFEFHGYHIPAGSLAFYSILGSHMMPSIFANPETFDPDRFAPPKEEHKKNPYALVSFGGGPHICIGMNLASVEIKAIVTHILCNYTLELIPDQEIYQFYGVVGWPVNGIRIRVSERIKRA
ncbi:MAG: cytochrome P450 [Chloroflexi bacterium]|nr:MAG: cytochrome P450 [Chloroflexota bacterium]